MLVYMNEVAKELAGINRTLEKIAEEMHKPENRAIRSLKMVVLIASALGILNIVELVRRWLTGG